MNYIIIDDEATSRTIIKGLCDEHNVLNFIDEFSSPIEALKFLNTTDIDLIFLDIHMPGFSGFDFIQTLKSSPKIILITSDSDFAIKAFEYPYVLDYLLKPIIPERFNLTIGKLNMYVKDASVSKENDQQADYLFVNINKRLVKIDFEDLCYIESKGDYVGVVTQTDTFVVHTTLKSLFSKLPESTFFKVHRSYVVNLQKVNQIIDNGIRVCETNIPLGKTYKNDFLKKLNLF